MAIAIYRLTWFALMILVMAPAFFYAGFVDGITYREAQAVVAQSMTGEYLLPWSIATVWCGPVAFVAQLLPASSLVAVMGFQMVWEHLGIVVALFFFATVRPPVFSWMRSKTDKEANALLVGE